MRITHTITLFMALALLPLPALAGDAAKMQDDPEARRIMTMVDERDDGDNRTSRMTMILADRHGGKRVRSLKTFTRDFGPDREHTYKLMFFLSPADVRDTGFLTYDYDGERDDDQWLYLPELRKTKRIASDDKTSAFMGSDFSYADMTKPELENYTFKLLGEKTVAGQDTWMIERHPASRAVVEKYGYTKSVLFVRKDCHVTIRAVHWEDKPNRFKYYEVTRLEPVDGIWTILEAEMTARQGKRFLHKTVLGYDDVRYAQALDNAFFTVRTLERGL